MEGKDAGAAAGWDPEEDIPGAEADGDGKVLGAGLKGEGAGADSDFGFLVSFRLCGPPFVL